MFNKIFYLILAIVSSVTVFSQEVTVDLQNSANNCGLTTDCNLNLVCFDIVMSVDQNKNLDSYNIWVTYDNAVLSRVNGGADSSCVIGDGGDTDLEISQSAYRVGGTPTAPFAMTANTPVSVHSICFSILDLASYDGTIISVGGDKFSGALRTTVTFNDATFDDTVAESFLTVSSATAPCFNTPPTITHPPVVTDEDSSVVICPILTDPDLGDSLTMTLCTPPSNGIAVLLLGDTCIEYTPNANYNGPDTVCAIVCDLAGACDTALIPITVTPINDAPIAVNDTVTTDEDTPVMITVTGNDTDVDGVIDVTTVTEVVSPMNGSTSVNGTTGVVTYTPVLNFNGVDSFSYSVCDDGMPVLCDTALVYINITAVNDTPTISNPPVFVPEDDTVVFCPSVGDVDLGDVLTMGLCTPPSNGTISFLAGDTCIEYIPNPGYNGPDTACVVVCDNGSPVLCDTILIPITVTPINDAPIAVNDTVTTDEDTPVMITVTGNDTDVDGVIDVTTVTEVVSPMNGSTSVNGTTGVVTYTPVLNFNGVDSFSYSVCDDGMPVLCDTALVYINITAVNDTPTISNPPVFVPEDDTVVFCPSVGDVDLGDVLTMGLCTPPSNGTISFLAGDTCIEYIPNPGYNGPDTACVVVCDNGSPVLCDTILIPITVTPINDAPIAVNDTVTTDEDTPVMITVTGNDTDVDGVIDVTTVTEVVSPMNGSTSVNGTTGVVTYTPVLNFNGVDSFSYSVCDDGMPVLCDTALVYINITAVNDTPTISNPPVFVPEDDTVVFCPSVGDVDLGDVLTMGLCTPPSNGTISFLAGDTCIEYIPNPGYNGPDTACVVVCDNGSPVLCDTILIPITVTPINDAPIAVNDTVTTDEDTPVMITVTGNDTDVDGVIDVTTVTEVVSPMNGSTSVNGTTGVVTYTPVLNFNGVDSFSYSVCDDGMPVLCDTALVYINITAVNDTPTISNPPVFVPEDDTVVFCPSVGDVDLGDVLTMGLCTPPSNGTISFLAGDTCIEYIPNPGYNGPDTACVVVCDNGSPVLCDTILIPITVTPINDAPIAVNDTVTTDEDTPVMITVTGNDTDVDGVIDVTTVTEVVSPMNGSTSVNGTTGVVTYTPVLNFNGVDSFSYSVCDDGMPVLCDTALVYINITAVNDTPTISNPPVFVPEDDTVVFCPSVGDVDLGDVLTMGLCTPPSNGTISFLAGDTCIEYIPNPGYNGPDTACVVVCDNGSPVLCDTVLIPITVGPINDTPTISQPPVIVPEDSLIVFCPTLTDPDLGDVLTVTSCGADNGTVSIDASNCVTYTPFSNYNGPDTVCLIVCDDGTPILCDTIDVPITVTPVNDTPTISHPPVFVPEDSTIVFCPDLDDIDVGDILTMSLCTPPNNGTLVLLPGDTCLQYTPNPNYNGPDTACVVVCDDGSPILCDTILIPIIVTPGPPNMNPTAVNDSAFTDEDVPVVIDVTANDFDDDSVDPTTVTIVSGPVNGTVVVNPVTGEVTYSPDTGFDGIDSFTYSICDNGFPVLCDEATVFINVYPNLVDTDGDGVTDDQEDIDGTDPLDPCDFLESSITLPVTAITDCDELLIPTGFSPNDDGVNDFFVIEGISKYPNAKLLIVNRWGNKVYESKNGYANDWDGYNTFGMTVGTRQLPVGTYFLILNLGDDSKPIKGYVYLNK